MIIYIHGFNGSGNGMKPAYLRDLFHGEVILSPDLPVHDAHATENKIDDIVKMSGDADIMFVGTSLGGFYADYFSKKYLSSAVLINPTTNPIKTFEFTIGNPTRYANQGNVILSKFDWSAMKRLYVDKNPNLTLVLLDKGDQAIDWKVAYKKYHKTNWVKTFENGSHDFDHMRAAGAAIEEIYYN